MQGAAGAATLRGTTVEGGLVAAIQARNPQLVMEILQMAAELGIAINVGLEIRARFFVDSYSTPASAPPVVNQPPAEAPVLPTDSVPRPYTGTPSSSASRPLTIEKPPVSLPTQSECEESGSDSFKRFLMDLHISRFGTGGYFGPWPGTSQLLKKKCDAPSRDRTGKVHGDLPDTVPENWTKEDLEDAARELRGSIARRTLEQIERSEDPAHRRRIEQERRLLRQIEKKLRGS
jgi:hypothetical protein